MPNLAPSDDSQLIQRIINRDESALLELYDRSHQAVFNLARYILRNDTQAEEVTQDVFFQIWRWPERWNPERGRLMTLILSITRYSAIDRLRREKRQSPLPPASLDKIADYLGRPSQMDDPGRDNGQLLRSLLKQLPQEQLLVIQLAFFRGMTHSEIAEQLKIPVGTVKSRIRLGLEKLKALWLEAVKERPTRS
jgi:RNA polymerase sigma-70 factor, ECF subfamily